MAESDMSTESDCRAAAALALGLSASEEQMSLEEQVARSFERWRDPIYRYLIGAGAAPQGMYQKGVRIDPLKGIYEVDLGENPMFQKMSFSTVLPQHRNHKEDYENEWSLDGNGGDDGTRNVSAV